MIDEQAALDELDAHWQLLMSEQAGQGDPAENKPCRDCGGPLKGYHDQWVTDAEGAGYICGSCDSEEEEKRDERTTSCDV